MSGMLGGLAAIFDGDKGAFLSVVLVVLLIVGVILLVLNLSMKPRGPPAPQWEPIAEEAEPAPVTPTPKPAPRRRA